MPSAMFATVARALLLLLAIAVTLAGATVQTARRVQLTESIDCFATFDGGPALWAALMAAAPAPLTASVDASAAAIAQVAAGLSAGRGACAVIASAVHRYTGGLTVAQEAACKARLAGTAFAGSAAPPVTHALIACLRKAAKAGRSMTLLNAEAETMMATDAQLSEALRMQSATVDADAQNNVA